MTDASDRHEFVNLDRRAALEFLRQHQPLPADADLTEEQIQTFDAVRRFFLQHPDKEAVPLLVNAFGEGSGFGVYQLVEDTLAQHDHEDVFAALDKALATGARGVRYWAGQIAARFPDRRLSANLSALLADSDSDIREVAITALWSIGDDDARRAIEERLSIEQNPEVRSFIRDTLADPPPPTDKKERGRQRSAT